MSLLPNLLVPKQKYFGLSIERTVLRAVEVDDHGNPTHIAEIQLPPHTFDKNLLTDENIFLKCVSELIHASKISTPYVVVCFPEVFAYTRGHTLPEMPVEDLDEAVKWQCKDLFPFPPDELYFDWKILEKNNNDIKVTVVAVQKIILDQLVGVLQKSGLRPLRFEPDASALARLLVLKPHEHALLVDVNPKGAYVTLVEGDKSLFTTVVPYTEGDQAETYIQSIDATVKEIDTFYKDKGVLTGSSVSMVVTGDVASPKWIEHLKQVLPYETKLLTTRMQDQRFSKAYAAAISGIEQPLDENSINVLPTALARQYEKERSEQFMTSILQRVLVIIFLFCIISGTTLGLSVWYKNSIDVRIKTLEQTVRSQPQNVEKLLQLNSQAKLITQLAPLRKTPLLYIDEVVSNASDEAIQITSVDYDDRRLLFKISGVASTRDALISFKVALEKSRYFSKVELPIGSWETPAQIPFIMTFLAKI